MESRPMAVKAQSPNHWTAREFPSHKVIFKERKHGDFGKLWNSEKYFIFTLE